MNKATPSVCMLVYSYYPDAVGGAERQCRLQALELAGRGHACLVLTSRSNKTIPRYQRDQGCEIVRVQLFSTLFGRLCKPPSPGSGKEIAVGGRRLRQTHLFAALRTWAAFAVRWLNAAFFMVGAWFVLVRRRRGIDVIHTHVAGWNAGFAGWIGHRLGIPVVAKAALLPAFPAIHGVPCSGCWTRWRTRIPYFALTDAMADDLVREGISRDRIRMIPNGVGIPADSARPELSTTVLYVGNFAQGAEHKAFDVLLQAWAGVATSSLENGHLIIAGAGSREQWKAYADQFGGRERIDFVGYQSDLAPFYRKSAIFVLPSRVEGISNALLEAMSYGLAVVVSDIPGNRSVVEHGVEGFVVPVGRIEPLKEAMMSLLNDPDLRQRMGATARERVQRTNAIAAVVDRVVGGYAELLDGTL